MAAYYNEIDPYAAQWLRNLIAENLIAPGDVDERDIRDIKPTELAGYTQCHFFAGIGGWSQALRLAGWPDDKPVWTGSCPCQPFSTAGRGEGFADERHLWPAWFHLIRECRPGVVFGEQVARGNIDWLELCASDMEGIDYAFGAADLVAVMHSPQERRRFYFVADTIAHGCDGTRVSQKRRANLSGPPRCADGFPWPSVPVPSNAQDFRDVLLLADGVSGELASIAAYGNAIVPQVAAEFITAYWHTEILS